MEELNDNESFYKNIIIIITILLLFHFFNKLGYNHLRKKKSIVGTSIKIHWNIVYSLQFLSNYKGLKNELKRGSIYNSLIKRA